MKTKPLTVQERADFVAWITTEAEDNSDFLTQLAEAWADRVGAKTFRSYYEPRVYSDSVCQTCDHPGLDHLGTGHTHCNHDDNGQPCNCRKFEHVPE